MSPENAKQVLEMVTRMTPPELPDDVPDSFRLKTLYEYVKIMHQLLVGTTVHLVELSQKHNGIAEAGAAQGKLFIQQSDFLRETFTEVFNQLKELRGDDRPPFDLGRFSLN